MHGMDWWCNGGRGKEGRLNEQRPGLESGAGDGRGCCEGVKEGASRYARLGLGFVGGCDGMGWARWVS